MPLSKACSVCHALIARPLRLLYSAGGTPTWALVCGEGAKNKTSPPKWEHEASPLGIFLSSTVIAFWGSNAACGLIRKQQNTCRVHIWQKSHPGKSTVKKKKTHNAFRVDEMNTEMSMRENTAQLCWPPLSYLQKLLLQNYSGVLFERKHIV